MLDQTRKDVDIWRQKCAETEKNLYEAREVGRQLDRLRNENEHLRIKSQDGDFAKKDNEILSTKLHGSEERVSKLDEECQSLKIKNEELDKNFKRTSKSLEDAKALREKDVTNIKMLEKENSNLKTQSEQMREEIYHLKQRLHEEIDIKIPHLEKQHDALKNEFHELKERLNTSERRGSVIPELETKLKEVTGDNEKLVSTLELVKKDYDNQRSRISEYERRIADSKTREEKLEIENETMNNDIGIILNKVNELEDRMSQQNQERDFLAHELNLYQQKLAMTEDQLSRTAQEKEDGFYSLTQLKEKEKTSAGVSSAKIDELQKNVSSYLTQNQN
jgi:chromosome segregation ATPase